VQDCGRGFDYSAQDLSMPAGGHCSRKQGLKLISALADRVEFNENGNRISIDYSVPVTFELDFSSGT